MVELLKKAGELGLLSAGVPEAYGGAGLDKISTTVLTEKLSVYAGFAVTHGAQTGIGTLPIVYFGTEDQKKKYLAQARHRRMDCGVLSFRAASWF